MKKQCSLGLGVAALLTAAALPAGAAFDGKVRIDDSPFQYGIGGEFQATPSAGMEFNINLGGYSPAVLFGYAPGSFPTFCVEYNEDVDFRTTYNARLNVATVNGGISGGNPDPISKGTAWLYTQFASGSLLGYDYNNDGAENFLYRSGFKSGRTGAAGLLQEAIWYLEGELKSTGTNPFLAQALVAATLGGYSLTEDNNGMFPVMAMNLFTDKGTYSQDQLVLVPEPGTYVAAALLLLPGLLGIMRFRAKSAAPKAV